MVKKRKVDQIAADCPTAWFAVLERAKRTGNGDLEVRALKELHRLGGRVVFSPNTESYCACDAKGKGNSQ